jgi:heat shock protein HslJ
VQEWIRHITDAWAACSGAVSTKPLVDRQPPETQQQQQEQQQQTVHQLAKEQYSAPPIRKSPEQEYATPNLKRQSMPPLPSGDNGAEGSRRSVCGIQIWQDDIRMQL